MAESISASQPTERVAFGRLWWIGLATIVAATLANFVIQQLAVALLQPDPLFGPLMVVPPILFTVIGVVGAIIVYALAGRFSSQPITLFRRIALIVLLVSLIPDVALLYANAMPGTTLGTIGALMLMHVAAWAITVGMLTTYARR